MNLLKCIFLLLFLPSLASAQFKRKHCSTKPNHTLILADKYYNKHEYYKAAELYTSVMKSDSLNAYALYQLAESQRLYQDYPTAESTYLKVLSKYKDNYPLSIFWYADVLKFNGKYKESIQYFEMYKMEATDTDLETELYRESASQRIIGCKLTIKVIENQQNNYTLTCLPFPVNTSEADFSTFIYNNDSSLAISSSRPGAIGNRDDFEKGGKRSDIYIVEKGKNEIWEISTNTNQDRFENVNSNYKDLAGCFSNNKTKYYFTRCDAEYKIENEEYTDCAIYVMTKQAGSWGKPVRLNTNINAPGDWNGQPFVTPDGRILFFVSSRTGGLGLKDIWYSTCDSADQWKAPSNLGDKINTLWNDEYPIYDADSKVLFFSSDGHSNYGGYDLFMTKEVEEFQRIYTLGFPFNSSADDFSLTLGNHMGYVTSNRIGGMGKSDVYSFTIESLNKFIEDISRQNSTH